MQAVLLTAVRAGPVVYGPVSAALLSSMVVHVATEVAVLQALAGMLMEQGLLALHRKQMGGFGASGRAGAFSAIAITPQVGAPSTKLCIQ